MEAAKGIRFENCRTGESGVIGERVRRRFLVLEESDLALTHIMLHYDTPFQYEMRVPLSNFNKGYYKEQL